MAQTDEPTTSDQPEFTDNRVLDEYEIPFGDWMDQAVDWIDVNMTTLLSIIEWPFDFLIRNFVDNFLVEISWVWVVVAFFIIGSLIRNVKVGVFCALALATCGILGNAYWLETARTIGFIFVAVLLCVAIGIPIGVACGRVDGVWRVVRPILDAMQVVHSFVYMLPFIFFFGIGPVSATMVTMVFALPPLIRLTNLGIRQVPEDVVEASRAYGAPEWRVLTDVQLPLARPAIMTGLNQTLLLAISMLGIAAIMGAGGLGRLLFRALSNQDVALATSGGLAFFLVAVVLDRISQREESDSGNLFHRIRLAWAHRRDPETLIPVEEAAEPAADPHPAPYLAPVTGYERTWMGVTVVGSIIALIALFLTWVTDASKMSAYGRRTDEEFLGESYNGLSASGGTWFGLIILGLAVFAIASVALTMRMPGKGPRWMTTDGVVIASLGMFLTALGYVLAWAPDNVPVETGIGVWVALLGTAVAAAGSLMWVRKAPHSPLHPLSADIGWGRIIGVAVSVVILVIAGFSGWSFDGRQDVVITPEIQAQIDALQEEATLDPSRAGPIGAEISALLATAQNTGVVVTDGFSDQGPGFGIWTLIMGLAAMAAALPAAGLFGRHEHREWVWSAIVAGIGIGISLVASGWIATHVRSADPNYVSGIGSFIAVLAGVFIAASSSSVLNEFRRTKIYADLPEIEEIIEVQTQVEAEEAVEEVEELV